MTRDIRTRLERLEAQSTPQGRSRFFTVEGPPDLPKGATEAFMRTRGHAWNADDLVFVTLYEARHARAPLRDLTKYRHGEAA